MNRLDLHNSIRWHESQLADLCTPRPQAELESWDLYDLRSYHNWLLQEYDAAYPNPSEAEAWEMA